VHLVGFTIEINHDARSHERQTKFQFWTRIILNCVNKLRQYQYSTAHYFKSA